MSTKVSPDRSKAAAMLGKKGGAAGKGACKRRSPEVIAKAVQARIEANRRRKEAQQQQEAA